MTTRSRLLTAAASLCCCGWMSQGAVGQAADSTQATLLAQGDGYFVHALPNISGHTLVHTVTETAIMKPILTVASPNVQSRRRAILGVVSDDERLYVLLHSELGDSELGDGELGDGGHARRNPHAGRDGHAPLQLYVFWLTDGSVLHREDFRLPADEDPLLETLGEGLLTARPDGVEFQQIGLIFDGQRLTSRYDPLSGTELPVEANVLDPLHDYGT